MGPALGFESRGGRVAVASFFLGCVNRRFTPMLTRQGSLGGRFQVSSSGRLKDPHVAHSACNGGGSCSTGFPRSAAPGGYKVVGTNGTDHHYFREAASPKLFLEPRVPTLLGVVLKDNQKGDQWLCSRPVSFFLESKA